MPMIPPMGVEASAAKLPDRLQAIGGGEASLSAAEAKRRKTFAALVIIFCFLAMGAVYFRPDGLNSGFTIKDVFQSLMSVVTLILGYLFGGNDRPSKDH